MAERRLFGVEGSSTFLECIPKSLQARVTWTFQKQPHNAKEEVKGKMTVKRHTVERSFIVTLSSH